MEPSATTNPASRSPTAKFANINGQMVNLHSLAVSYRICVIAVVGSFLALFFSVVLMAYGIVVLGSLLFVSGQLACGIAIATAFRISRIGDDAVAIPRRKPTFIVFRVAFDAFTAVVAAFPIFGLMPAANFCNWAHRVFNTLGVPVGILGPSQAVISTLRLGLCHRCGYDISQQPGNLCPECGSDISSDKPAPGGLSAVQIDRRRARVLAGRCILVGAIGLALGIIQTQLVLPYKPSKSDIAFWTWLIGAIWGVVAMVLAGRSLRALAARGALDHIVVLLTSLISPLVGAIVLLWIALRLRSAAKTGTPK
jgi:hypothetical protein